MMSWKKTVAIFMSSQTLSLLGSSLVMYTLMWYVTLSTQSGIMMTIYVLSSFVPSLLISPFAGVWADKLNRKKIMIFADLFIALWTLFIVILFFLSIESIWMIFVVTIIRSIGQSIHQPAVSAVYPQIVPKDALLKVQGISQSIQSMSMVLMPLLAGLLLTFADIQYLMLIDVITAFIAVFILIKFVKLPKHEAEHSSDKIEYFKEIKLGIQYAISHPFILNLLIFSFMFMFMVAAPSFLTYLQVARVFGPEAWRLAVLEAFFGVGMVLGSLTITLWGGFKNRLKTYFYSFILIGIAVIGLGLPESFWVYMSFWTMAGFFIALSSPIIAALIQEKVDPLFIGRIFSVFGLIQLVSLPLGMLLFGPLSDQVDISNIILIAGCIMVVLAIIPLSMKNFLKHGLKDNPNLKGEHIA